MFRPNFFLLSNAFLFFLSIFLNLLTRCGKAPRIQKSLLQRCQLSCGLSLPNFLFYYCSANILKLTFWYSSSTASWCRLEASACTSTSLLALLTSPLPSNPSSPSFAHNSIVASILWIWCQFRRHLNSLSPQH